MTPLEQVLWTVAGLLAIVAVIAYSTSATPKSTPIAAAVFSPVPTTSSPTATPTVTPRPLPTSTRAATNVGSREPLEIPTPPPDAILLTFSPNPERTGWVGSKELGPHWRDRNLYSGSFQGQTLAGVVQFDLRSLAPGSKILYAALELTGRNARNLGSNGEWTLALIPSGPDSSWGDVTFDLVSQARALTSSPVLASNLAVGQSNDFVFDTNQLKVLESQLDLGIVTFRLEGPSEPKDNLFTWEAGPGAGEPTLYVVVIPASFVVITATPAPADLFAAATQAARQTEQVRQFGTPTPFPRSIATATPGATGVVVVTSVPTPMNLGTAAARSVYATAVAATTGTFTPTPPNMITTTPTPPFIGVAQFTPAPTPFPRPTEVSLLEYRKTPIPTESGLIGRIVFMTDRDGGQAQVWVMESNGALVGKLTGADLYRVAQAHDLYSPDWQYQLDLGRDERNMWQIVLYDIAKGFFSPLIQEERRSDGSGVFDPSWSPDGSKIAYASNAVGTEIWLYDVATKARKRLTYSPSDPTAGAYTHNRHPSWSPDGKSIVFSSIAPKGTWQIWVINADGSGARILSPSAFNDYDPVWIKR